jgi:hypothetical protein
MSGFGIPLYFNLSDDDIHSDIASTNIRVKFRHSLTNEVENAELWINK